MIVLGIFSIASMIAVTVVSMATDADSMIGIQLLVMLCVVIAVSLGVALTI